MAREPRADGGFQPIAPTTATGWARTQETIRRESNCADCGVRLGTCLGCGQVRCLECEPYLSDDCRWLI